MAEHTTEQLPEGLDPDILKRIVTVSAETRHLERMQHEATTAQFDSTFTFYSDEPPNMRGDDEYPYPLHYLTASIGLCHLTQIMRYSRMLKVDVTEARCTVKAHWTSEGSVFDGTIQSHCHAVELHTEVVSDDDPARVAAVIRNAEGGCYAQATVTQAVPITATTTFNGEPLDHSAYPRKVPRR